MVAPWELDHQGSLARQTETVVRPRSSALLAQCSLSNLSSEQRDYHAAAILRWRQVRRRAIGRAAWLLGLTAEVPIVSHAGHAT